MKKDAAKVEQSATLYRRYRPGSFAEVRGQEPIVAALEVLWPKAAAVYEETSTGNDNSWRFSGRWWSKPIASRRARPW